MIEMQQNQMNNSNSSYYQYYQSHFQNINPNSSIIHPPNFNPNSTASAPPASSDYFEFNPDSEPYSVPQSYDQPQFAPVPAPSNYDYSNHNYDPNLTIPSSYYPYNHTDQAAGEWDGVYAYNGGTIKVERSGQPESSSRLSFDDYGRPINVAIGDRESRLGILNNDLVKAVPKIDMEEDVGVQKFRVRVLAESGGERDMDFLCQIGLDAIRILDAATSRTLKIYPLETVTRWEVLDSTIFAFWAKSSIDIEARRIRLKSTSYTTNNILDTIVAATIQFKEMRASDRSSDQIKAEQLSDKKKGFSDLMNLIKPGNEEKDHWVPDEATTKCTACRIDFGAFVRRHHCRNCGDIFCDKCTQGRIALTADDQGQPVRVCDQCMAEVTQRLTNAMEPVKVSASHSHGDLAKKLQEEMAKNRKRSTGLKSNLKSNGSDIRMREVECPTCTVHLQVQVPASGSVTTECSVCQNPFLVNAN